MESALFAFGTLMCEDIMQLIVGIQREPITATLDGYSRRSVKGQRYPALVADQQSQVEGQIYSEISALGWERLDQFEGEMYDRRTVKVTLASGCIVEADVYLTQPSFLHMLEPFEWDFESFLQHDKNDYLNLFL
jgi:gamma-glutamylcyclotransferase (GGCT)/AIG2-like uncharacterized protein YtfP